MVIIGTLCVTSVTFENQSLQSLFINHPKTPYFEVLSKPIPIRKHGLLGQFHYGGSTIVILVPPASSNHLLTRILLASNKNIETEITVGQPVLFYQPINI